MLAAKRPRHITLLIGLALGLGLTSCKSAEPKAQAFGWSAAERQALRQQPDLSGRTLAQQGWLQLVEGEMSAAGRNLAQAGQDLELPVKLRRRAWLGSGFAKLAQADFPAAAQAFLSCLGIAPAEGAEATLAAAQLAEVLHQIPSGHIRHQGEIEMLLDRPDTHAATRRNLRVILHEGARRGGQLERADSLGIPTAWSILGPCGRHPWLAFDSIHDAAKPENQLDCSQPPRPAWSHDLRLELEPHPHAGVFLARTWLQMDSPQTLRLRVETDEPFILSINDQSLSKHNRHLEHLPRVLHLQVQVSVGWHQLQLSLPLERKSQVALELVPTDGSSLRGRWWDGRSPPPPACDGQLTHSEVLPSEALALESELAQSSSDPIIAWLAGLTRWDEGLIGTGQAHMETAIDRAPDFALARYMRALMLLTDPDLPDGIDRIRAREELSRAVRGARDFTLAEFRLALLEAEQGQEEKALARLRELDARAPLVFLWPHFRSLLEGKLGWSQQAHLSLQQARRRLPDQPFLLLRSFEQARQRNALALSTTLAEDLAKLQREPELLADFWLERGETIKAEKILKELLSKRPDRVAPLRKLALGAIRSKHFSTAEGLLAQAERLKPGAIQLGELRAEWLDAQGRHDEAKALRAELALKAPWNLKLLKQVAALRNGFVHLPGETRVNPQSIIEEYKKSKFSPQGDAVLVLDQATTQVAEDGSSVTHVHMIAHVLTSDGLERWGELDQIPETAWIETVRTIRADGQSLEAERHPNKDSISLPGLQVGDFVELSYLLPAVHASPMARSFLGKRFYFRSQATGIFRSIYTLAIPEDIELDMQGFHAAPQASLERQGRHKIYRFASEKVGGIEKEAHAPPMDDFAPFVQTGFGITWLDYRNILASQLRRAIRHDSDLDDYLGQLQQGEERARLRQLFHRVCADIQDKSFGDNFDEPASHILAKREGNRLVLLTALLSRLGYQPRIFLARTITDIQTEHPLPLGGVYTHGVLQVPLKDSPDSVWMDPVAQYHPFDRLFDFVAGMRAMDLSAAPQGPVWTRLPAKVGPKGSKHIDMNLHLEVDGTIHGQGSEKLSSSQAVHYRKLLSGMSPTIRRQILEAGLGQTFSGAMLEDFRIQGLEEPDSPLLITYAFRAPGYARLNPRGLLLRGGFFAYQLSSNLVSKAERSSPLVMGDATRTHTRVRIALPPGAKLDKPKRLELSAPLSDFTFRLDQRGGVLELDKHLEVLAGRVAPGEYANFRDFCKQVDEADSEAIQILLEPLATAP